MGHAAYQIKGPEEKNNLQVTEMFSLASCYLGGLLGLGRKNFSVIGHKA